MKPVVAVACGARVRWVVEDVIAVSPMPCPDELEKIAAEFSTLVSTATWVEHSYYGYDPRTASRLFKRFLWLPTGEYNAPPLKRLVELLASIEPPVLVHCLRGAGRAAVVAAAWLIAVRRYRLPEALVQLSQSGARVETLPQSTVLRALDYLSRHKLLDLAVSEGGEGASVEYAALLARELGVELTAGEPAGLWTAARALGRWSDYTIADIAVSRKDSMVRLVCWVERSAHPRSARRWGCPPQPPAEVLEGLRGYGVEGISVENVDRYHVPAARF